MLNNIDIKAKAKIKRKDDYMNRKPILGILLGDGAGVGAEIIAKLAASGFYEEYCRPVVIGDVRIFERGACWTKRTWTLRKCHMDRYI